jgi:hypothetical protein
MAPQEAERGMPNTYIGGGYRGNKILGADQNRRCCPAAVVRNTATRDMGPDRKIPGPPGRVLRIILSDRVKQINSDAYSTASVR